jgi:hypothetical protein
MGSIPNGSAPLQACARQIYIYIPPGRTGKAQVIKNILRPKPEGGLRLLT